MDFAPRTNKSKESEHPHSRCFNKLETQSEVVELRGPGATSALGPATPDADREIVDFPSDYKSPLTQVKDNRFFKLISIDSSLDATYEAPLEGFENHCSPRTPKDGVFDPFSPGPASMALAPISRKYFSASVGYVARRLEFGCSMQAVEVDEQSISDGELLEAVYESLMEVIVSNQAEAALAPLLNSQSDSDDSKTPPGPHLSGIAQTCPGAPVKASAKLRNFELGLCRKLEF